MLHQLVCEICAFGYAKLKGKAQPQVGVSVHRRVAVPPRYAAARGTGVPAATTIHAVRGGSRTCRIGLLFTGIAVEPVLTPLTDVTAHIIQAQLVRSLGSHWIGLVVGIVTVPSNIPNRVTAGIFVTQALVAATSSEFPLRLGQQTEILARQLVQAREKRLAVILAHLLHRTLEMS